MAMKIRLKLTKGPLLFIPVPNFLLGIVLSRVGSKPAVFPSCG